MRRSAERRAGEGAQRETDPEEEEGVPGEGAGGTAQARRYEGVTQNPVLGGTLAGRSRNSSDAHFNSIPAGSGDLIPVIGFFCQRCEEFFGDLSSAEGHKHTSTQQVCMGAAREPI